MFYRNSFLAGYDCYTNRGAVLGELFYHFDLLIQQKDDELFGSSTTATTFRLLTNPIDYLVRGLEVIENYTNFDIGGDLIMDNIYDKDLDS